MKKSIKKLLSVVIVLGLLLSTFVVSGPVQAAGPTTIYTSPTGTLAPGTLYPRAMQTSNGKLYATWESYTTGVSTFPIFESLDLGVSWAKVGDVIDTHKQQGMRWEPTLFELPQAIGDMPKGTLLASGLVLPYDRSICEIDMYKSNDEGRTWTFVSEIALGKQANPGNDPVWEPFFLVHNDKLICYYSDERDPAHGQKLVHQTTTDGVNWGPVVDDVADPKASQRPGMSTVAQMPDGKFILTYEIMGTPSGAYYKISDDPENFNATEPGICFDPAGSGPYVVNLNGTMILSSGGNSNLYINTNSGIGGWEQISSPIGACYSRCLVPLQNGRLFVINAGWNGSGLNSVTCADMAVVPPAQLSDIKLDGTTLNGFTPTNTGYSLLLPSSATTVPTITATAAPGRGTITSIVPASSIPGTTTIAVDNGTDTRNYTVSFGYAPTSSSFMDGTIDSGWTILRENKATYSVVAGKGLMLPTQRYDIYSNNHAAWENVFTRPAAGDWDAVSKVYYPNGLMATYQQQALLAWQDEDNYVKVACQSNGTNGKVTVGISSEKGGTYTGGSTKDITITSGAAININYKLVKVGSTYTGYYSTDRVNYTLIGSVTVGISPTSIGVFATRNSTSVSVDTYCQGVDIVSLIQPYGTVAPTWPQGSTLTASNVTSSDITLKWAAAKDEKAVTGYRIYKGSSLLTTVAADVLSYTVTGLTPKTEYTFKVEAVDGDGAWSTSGPSTTVTTLTDKEAVFVTANDIVTAGQAFEVNVGLNALNNKILDADISIGYDSNLFEYVTASVPEVGLDIVGSDSITTPGAVRLLLAGLGIEDFVTGNVPMLKLTFNAKAVGSGNISATNAIFVNTSGSAITAQLYDKTVKVVANTSALTTAIATAQGIYDQASEGSSLGQYPIGSKAVLKAAIDHANAVLTDTTTTQAQVDSEIGTLQSAVNVFKASVIKTTGDITGDNKVDIYDLNAISRSYGKTSSSPDWNDDAIKADFNKDGKVNLLDLVAVAMKILQK